MNKLTWLVFIFPKLSLLLNLWICEYQFVWQRRPKFPNGKHKMNKPTLTICRIFRIYSYESIHSWLKAFNPEISSPTDDIIIRETLIHIQKSVNASNTPGAKKSMQPQPKYKSKCGQPVKPISCLNDSTKAPQKTYHMSALLK